MTINSIIERQLSCQFFSSLLKVKYSKYWRKDRLNRSENANLQPSINFANCLVGSIFDLSNKLRSQLKIRKDVFLKFISLTKLVKEMDKDKHAK